MKDQPTVFMGTPEVAVPFLEQLHRMTDVRLVVTQPDRPRGRKQILMPTPVKQRAGELGIPVVQPEKIRSNESLKSKLRGIGPALILVVAYGRILPVDILDIPQYGCVNVHFSLLPRYRGAAPVNRALENGEATSGVTLIKMDPGMDTGPIIASRETAVGPDETAPELFDRLTALGVNLFSETLENYLNGRIDPEPQNHERASSAPMMEKSEGWLNFELPARTLHNRIRAFQPWPGTRACVGNSLFKFVQTAVEEGIGSGVSGTVERNGKQLSVVCGKNSRLVLLKLQPENRKPMDSAALLNGGYLKEGDRFD